MAIAAGTGLSAAIAGSLDAPWFLPHAVRLHTLVAMTGAAERISQLDRWAKSAGIVTGSGRPVRFEPADDDRAPYEAGIWASGRVPTRTGPDDAAWHDLFNALAWLRFPRVKATLNRLQAEVITRDGVGPSRGGLRDAATLFDENGLLLLAAADGEARIDAIRDRRWHDALSVDRRRFADQVGVVVFGHALLQKLAAPYKAITGHGWVVDSPAVRGPASGAQAEAIDDWFAAVDARVAATIDADRLRAARFVPLPVLGVPGWWPANESAGFYDDPAVFRPARRPDAEDGRT